MRVSPPLSSLSAELGTHLVQVKVQVSFVWAGLQLKGPRRGPVVAAPGVEDEGAGGDLQIRKIILLFSTLTNQSQEISQFLDHIEFFLLLQRSTM